MSPRDARDEGIGSRRRRQLDRRRRRARRGVRRGNVLAVIGGLFVLAVGGLFVAAGVLLGGLPDLGKAAAVQLGQNSVVKSGDKVLSVIPANENRTPLRWKDLGAHLRNATVAIEDKRYWQHGALDYEGIGRALWRDITKGNYAEGGSTITQQLVRNLYIPDNARDKTVQRKLDEAWLAIQAEDRWTKAQILTMYLNTVFYGRYAYGAEAAAETYFNKHAKQLTLPQAALLAGLPQAPSDYDPFKNPVLAKQRRNDVLRAMRQQHMISVETFDRALRAPLGLAGRPALLHGAPALLRELRQAGADRQAARRSRAAAEGRPLDRDHGEPAPAVRGAARDRRRAEDAGRPRCRDRVDPAAHRCHRGDAVEHQLRIAALQPRDAGRTPGRLDVQDDRADRRGRRRHRPERHLLPVDGELGLRARRSARRRGTSRPTSTRARAPSP